MTRVTLVRAWPRDPATGATIAVKLAGGGEIVPYPSGYRAGIIHEPRFSGALGFEQDGWSGGVVPNATAINFQPSDTALLDTLIGYYWTRAAIEIDVTEETAAPARRLTGIVASVSEREGVLSITAADLGHALAGPLATGTFAGTGGIEGVAAAEGRIKRRSWGRVFNVEGRLLDSVNNIYEFGDPSKKLQGCTALRDKGKAGALTILAWGGSIAATFAALQASVPPTGGGVFAPSIACAKWWTQPAGPLTADLLGEIGTGYVEKVAEIASTISAELGGPAISNLAAATALRPDAVGWHIDTATETGAAVLDKMLAGASLFWVLDPAGTIRIGEWTWSGAAEAVTGIYEGSDRQFAPHKSRKIGYYRNQHVHADGDIAADIPASSVLVGGVAVDTLIAQAQADADTALADLADIASDSLLTPDEKPRQIERRDTIVNEQGGIDAAATTLSITTEKTTYDNAVTALINYLATLTTPVLWSNLAGDTAIVGTTFRQKFIDVSTAKQALLNKISTEAAKRADLMLGANLIANSEFTNGLTGWSAGWDGNTGLPVTRGIDHAGYFGTKRVAYAYVTGTPAAGTVFDAYYSMGSWVSNIDQARKWAVPVLPGEKLYYSALVAGHRCNVFANLQYRDANGDYHSEAGSAQAPVAGPNFANGDPANATRVGAFHTVPNGARFAFLNIRAVCPGGQANPYIFHTDGFIAKVDPNQTAIPPYTMGPGDRRADVTGENTANNTANVGAKTTTQLLSDLSAAQTQANNATIDAADAQIRIQNIVADNVLDKSEKPDVVQRYTTLTGEQASIDARATAYGITTEKTAYDNAVSALTSYLAGLSPAYTSYTTDTSINRTTFNQKFTDVTNARQAVLDKIAEIAGQRATWAGVSGTGKPADNATVGAPAGTNVGSTPAATVESGANKGNAGLDGSGNVLTNKVGTGSIVPNAVILPGYSGLASDYDVTTYNSWVDVLTSTATTIGASVDAGTSFSLIGLGTSPPSFAFAYCLVRLVVDGTILKDWIVSAYILDAATATANDIAFSGYERSYGTMHTPSAAAHTWKLQAYLDNTGSAWSAYSAKLRFLKGSNIKPAEYRR